MGAPFIHPTALVEGDSIGEDTRIWAFAHVMDETVIGKHCNLGDHTFVESGAILGDRVTVKNGVSIWEGVVIEDDVFLGPNCVLTNDRNPRSRQDYHQEKTLICRGATIGANATVLCGIVVGEYAMIGAGAVVTKDVPPYALMLGAPARFVGWVCRCGQRIRDGARIHCDSCGSFYESKGNVILPMD